MVAATIVAPRPEEIAVARTAARQLDDAGTCNARLRFDSSDNDVLVPGSAITALQNVLAAFGEGTAVVLASAGAELTTQQAAQVLNVSRPFVIKLLDAGEIAYRRVGKHRRVDAASLEEYRLASLPVRRAAADELAALARELDLP